MRIYRNALILAHIKGIGAGLRHIKAGLRYWVRDRLSEVIEYLRLVHSRLG